MNILCRDKRLTPLTDVWASINTLHVAQLLQ